METYCNWYTELRIQITTPDEREMVEEFVVAGRAAEVHVPRHGDVLQLRDKTEARSVKIVRCLPGGHQLLRRTNPWIWKTSWDILAREIPPED